MSEELKSCPCCAHAAKLVNNLKTYWGNDGGYVYCGACGIQTDTTTNYKEAIRTWNKRAFDPTSNQNASVKLFARWVIEQCWDASIDCGEVQDKAEELGLIEVGDEAEMLYFFTEELTV